MSDLVQPTLKRSADSTTEGDSDYVPTPPAKKPRASGAGVKKPRTSASASSAPGKCGMTKKELGDAIQAGLKCVSHHIMHQVEDPMEV
jgi:hypothetical protein